MLEQLGQGPEWAETRLETRLEDHVGGSQECEGHDSMACSLAASAVLWLVVPWIEGVVPV